jgi:8-oxo-dGDP phosphatase
MSAGEQVSDLRERAEGEPSASEPKGALKKPGGEREGERAELRDVVESWPVTGTDELVCGQLVTVRRDTVQIPGGRRVGREVVEHPGAVAVVALDEAGQVLLIRQYRHPAGRLLWELPAGLRDVAGEPLVETARRELLEEAGYLAARWQVLADYFSSPGISTERLRIFLARDLQWVPEAERDYVRHDEEAHLVVEWAPLDAVVCGVLAGDLHNGVLAVGVLAAFAARQDGFAALRGTDEPEA